MAISRSVLCLSFLPADLKGEVAGFCFLGCFWQAEMKSQGAGCTVVQTLRSQGAGCTVIQAQNQDSQPNLEPTIETQGAMSGIH